MKKVLMLILALGLCLARCDAGSGAASEQVISAASAGDCFLCGDSDSSYWGQNNVGFISLNTCQVMPLEINRYDIDGVLIEKNAGYAQSRGLQTPKNGFSAYMMQDPDCGYATGEISLRGDEALVMENAAAFLCEDCLHAVLSGVHEHSFGVGVINFETREIRALESCVTGFGLGDFYIHCDWKQRDSAKDSQKADILVFYCPQRYDGDE